MTGNEVLNKLVEHFGDRLRASAGNNTEITVYIQKGEEVKPYVLKEFTQEALDKFINEIER